MRERPLKTPREVSKSWSRRFICGYGCGESSGREFGWLGMVDMDCSPRRTIFIHQLVWIGDSFYHEWALPSWSQLFGTHRRSGQHKYETSLAIWIGSGRSWGWGHLLVGHREPLFERINVCGSVIKGWRSASVTLCSRGLGEVWALSLWQSWRLRSHGARGPWRSKPT